MHWGLIVSGVALVACGTLIGCGTNAEIKGQTAQEKFQFVASRNPNYAFGLGYADGSAPAQIMVAGMTEKRGKVAVPEDARWHIGSISKSFTSALIMRLVERGVLDLDTPIETYLPSYATTMHPQWRATTLRQLLSHTSGAQPNLAMRELEPSLQYEAFSGRRTVMAGIWTEPMEGTPGAFEYSNIGYVVAGMVAEEVMDATWEDLIRSEIARPLRLTSLGFGAPTGETDPRGHISMFGFTRAVDPNSIEADNPAWMGPAGTIHLSLADLVKWGQTQLRACRGELPEFMSIESCRTLQQPVSDDYALGWVVESNAPDRTTLWHNGSNVRWYAILYLDPKRGTSVAVVTNTADSKNADALVRAVSRDM